MLARRSWAGYLSVKSRVGSKILNWNFLRLIVNRWVVYSKKYRFGCFGFFPWLPSLEHCKQRSSVLRFLGALSIYQVRPVVAFTGEP